MLARMGWQPGQGLGKQPGSAVLVLPQLKWDKTGLGGSTHVKQLGAPATRFRSAGVTLPPGAAASAALRCPLTLRLLRQGLRLWLVPVPTPTTTRLHQ